MRVLVLPALALMAGLATASVSAGSLRVGPTRVLLTEANPVGTVSVSNAGAGDMVVELEATDWVQRVTDDDYPLSAELVATPPVFRLGPGRSQVVRIGLRNGFSPHTERAFRLFVREVPPDSDAAEGGLHIALRIGVPVFARANALAAGAVRWRMHRASDGSLVLRAENDGAAFLHVKSVSLTMADDPQPAWKSKEAGYVLGKSVHEWTRISSAGSKDARTARLHAELDENSVETEIAIEP